MPNDSTLPEMQKKDIILGGWFLKISQKLAKSA